MQTNTALNNSLSTLSPFARAVVLNDNSNGVTTNGARTNKSSLSAMVDLFFQAGSSRGKDISNQFRAAYAENPELAIRLLLWLRDARGGAGEREQFRKLWNTLAQIDETMALRIIPYIPSLGRWDDLLEAPTPRAQDAALTDIATALEAGDRLCAKWMPRKGPKANALRKFLGLTPKAYRKLLVGLSDTVEQKMCAKEWEAINFAHVPSVAASRYQKAFGRNAAESYAAYKAALEKGETKVNASVLFPHDVILANRRGDAKVSEAQWKALPDYIGDGEGMLPLIDVSGSMDNPLGRGSVKTSVTCMDTSIALGLYVAERQKGAFHNVCMTFSSTANAVVLKDNQSLSQKIRSVQMNTFMGSTNISAAFGKILEIALENGVSQKYMPKKLLILSDMEFDAAVSTGGSFTDRRVADLRNNSALDMVRRAYKAAGYDLPQIVFWNLNARAGNCPATIRDDGTALVSGYSPSILKAILAGKTITPESAMLEALMVERYNF